MSCMYIGFYPCEQVPSSSPMLWRCFCVEYRCFSWKAPLVSSAAKARSTCGERCRYCRVSMCSGKYKLCLWFVCLNISHFVHYNLLSCPGTGISVVFVNTMMSIYYNVIIAYSLYYMFASFQSPLPWSSCFSWADSNCSGKPLGTPHCHFWKSHGLFSECWSVILKPSPTKFIVCDGACILQTFWELPFSLMSSICIRNQELMCLFFVVYCNVSGVLVGNWTQGNSTSCPSSNQVTVPVQSPSEQYWE